MTIQQILDMLKQTQDKLDAAGVNDSSRLDLHIMILQLNRQLMVAATDPLLDIDKVTVADTSKLPGLVAQVDVEIANEKARTDLVEKIISTAKIALRAGGIALP